MTDPAPHRFDRPGGGLLVFWLVVLLGALGGVVYLHYRPGGGALIGTPLAPYLIWVIWACVALALLAVLRLFSLIHRQTRLRSDFHLNRARHAEGAVGRLLKEIRAACGEAYGAGPDADPPADHPMAQWRAGHDTQREEISGIAGEIASLAAGLGRINESATESAEGMRRLSEVAGKGAAAVRNTVAGLNDTHDRIQEAAERLAELARNTRHFDETVGLMGEVAEHISLLSLNATFCGRMGGPSALAEAAETAEEMRRLADRATRAAGKITDLAQTIHTDTDGVIASLRDTVGQAAGRAPAGEAGRALAEIESAGRKLLESTGQALSGAADEVARAQLVGDKVKRLKHAAEQSRADASRVVVGMENLRVAAGLAHSDVAGSRKR